MKFTPSVRLLFLGRFTHARWGVFALVVATMAVAWAGSASAQSDDVDQMKLSLRVAELQLQLEDANLTKRDAAEQELIELGEAALRHLAPVTEDTPTETIERISRVRGTLEAAAVEAFVQARKLSLQGTFTVKQAIELLAKESKNDIVWPDQVESALSTREIALDIVDASFWQVLNELANKASLRIDSFNSPAGKIMLVPSAAPLPRRPVDSSGIFQVSVLQVSASRNLENPALDYCGVRVRIRWEPRLVPFRLSIPADSIRVVDEFDEEIKLPNPDAVLSASVQPEIPEVEMVIPIGLVDRQVENIRELHATVKATLPGRSESFEFKKIGRLAAGYRQSKAGVSVAYEGFEKNEDLYGVKVSFTFDQVDGGLDSHLSWVYENPLYLVDAQGQKYLALTQESAGRTGNSVAIRYYFSDNPAPMDLHCQTPAAIISSDVKILLKDIPLP